MSWVPRSHWWAALAAVITVQCFASELYEIFPDLLVYGAHADGFFRLLGLSVAMVIMVQWLYCERLGFLGHVRTRELRKEDPAEKRSHLVLFLSNLKVTENDPCGGIPKALEPPWSLPAHLDILVERKKQDPKDQWPWEMPLRAMLHHAPVLKTVSLVCSPESIRQVHWFCAAARRYVPFSGLHFQVPTTDDGGAIRLADVPSSRLGEGGVKFDEFDDLWSATRQVIAELLRHGAGEEEIMIDFTGGPKVASVVAAAATFNRHIKAQYVDTNWPHHVISYDLVMETPHDAGPEL